MASENGTRLLDREWSQNRRASAQSCAGLEPSARRPGSAGTAVDQKRGHRRPVWLPSGSVKGNSFAALEPERAMRSSVVRTQTRQRWSSKQGTRRDDGLQTARVSASGWFPSTSSSGDSAFNARRDPASSGPGQKNFSTSYRHVPVEQHTHERYERAPAALPAELGTSAGLPVRARPPLHPVTTNYTAVHQSTGNVETLAAPECKLPETAQAVMAWLDDIPLRSASNASAAGTAGDHDSDCLPSAAPDYHGRTCETGHMTVVDRATLVACPSPAAITRASDHLGSQKNVESAGQLQRRPRVWLGDRRQCSSWSATFQSPWRRFANRCARAAVAAVTFCSIHNRCSRSRSGHNRYRPAGGPHAVAHPRVDWSVPGVRLPRTAHGKAKDRMDSLMRNMDWTVLAAGALVCATL
eukprot:jgi/Ulvmu1/2911/UM147_0009.1